MMMNKGMMSGCTPAMIGSILVIIGAVNWGLVGLGGFFGGDWNVVHLILGSIRELEWAVYILVGIAGIAQLIGCKCGRCSSCKTCMAPEGTMRN